MIDYKPGWNVEFRQGRLHVVMPDVPDSRGVGQARRIGQSVAVPADLPADQMPEFIRNAVLTVECHEMDEWLKIDGQLLTDPHSHEGYSQP